MVLNFMNIIILSFPLVIGGILHMVVVKLDIFPILKVPIHKAWFGVNKTWRGIIIMPLATFPGVVLSKFLELSYYGEAKVFGAYSEIIWALILGLGYCLPELPNSFVKRRLGINEGSNPEYNRWLFIIVDQSDSIIGCALIFKILNFINWPLFFSVILFGTALHLLLNFSLYKLKIRRNPF